MIICTHGVDNDSNKLKGDMIMKKAKQIQIRKLEETSWLAQILADKMHLEWDKNRASVYWHSLQTLKIIINEADDDENNKIYYDNSTKRKVVICEIPSLIEKHGTDYSTYGMQCSLRGLAERYRDDDGLYIVSVLTTHDLNSAIINDLSELLYQMGRIE